jgi:hypothetical protein
MARRDWSLTCIFSGVVTFAMRISKAGLKTEGHPILFPSLFLPHLFMRQQEGGPFALAAATPFISAGLVSYLRSRRIFGGLGAVHLCVNSVDSIINEKIIEAGLE